MMSLVNWLLGVGMPLITGGAALAGALAAYAYIPKIAWLPDVRTPVCAALVAIGVGLISYSQGYASARGDHAVEELREQARNLQASLNEFKGATEAASNLQAAMSEQARKNVELVAQQRAQADDLIQQLQTKPVPAGCDWAPNELRGVQSIRINRAPRGAGAAPR